MLSIGNVTVKSPLVLAPMAGISDLPYRMLNRSFWSGLAFTEMISATALANTNSSTVKRLSFSGDDRPLGIQIVGRNPEIIKRALDNVAAYEFDIVDFNAACPVKKVASKGKGAGLLREPEKLRQILKVMVEHAGMPVTVKIRSGWDDTSVNAVETALLAQDAGVSALTIHGRTRAQRYSGTVDYPVIRKVKEALDIPVIASGDALSPQLVGKLFDETGCDGVAIARGALGNPWIFPETAEYLKNREVSAGPSVPDIVRVMKRHLTAYITYHGERIAVIQFRKFFSWYTKGMSVRELKVRAFMACTGDEMMGLIDELHACTSRQARTFPDKVSA